MEENKSLRISLDGFFRQNIVLMSGLVTAPIIVAATTFERALVLSISFLMISYISILICRAIPRKIAYALRIIIYALVAAVVFIPTVLLLKHLFPETTQSVMIYIEIIVVNSLILSKTESRFYIQPFKIMAVEALIYIAGYIMAAFVVGTLRELLAYGTLFGFYICDAPVPAAKTPFFGFVLVGVLAALCRAVNYKLRSRRSNDSQVIRKGADGI